jgi:hypothetical protein
MRKYFIIFLVLFIVVAVLALVYNFAFKPQEVENPKVDAPETTDTNTEQSAEESFITKGEEEPKTPVSIGGIDTVLSAKILSATMTSTNDLLYADKESNTLRKRSETGGAPEILAENLPGTLKRVVWSPRAEDAQLLLATPEGDRWYYAEFATKTVNPHKKEIGRLSYNAQGDRIVYQYTDAKSGAVTLDTAAVDGGDYRTIASLESRMSYYFAPVPRSTSVVYWKRPRGGEESSITTISTLSQGQTKVSEFKRYGVSVLPSSDGGLLLVSSAIDRNAGKQVLGTLDTTTGAYTNLDIPTMVTKAVWGRDGSTLYYALPMGTTPAGSVLPDDYFGKPIYTEDTWWRIDVKTGKKQRLIDLDKANVTPDTFEPFIDSREEYLYFIDRKTEKLLRIAL